MFTYSFILIVGMIGTGEPPVWTDGSKPWRFFCSSGNSQADATTEEDGERS